MFKAQHRFRSEPSFFMRKVPKRRNGSQDKEIAVSLSIFYYTWEMLLETPNYYALLSTSEQLHSQLTLILSDTSQGVLLVLYYMDRSIHRSYSKKHSRTTYQSHLSQINIHSLKKQTVRLQQIFLQYLPIDCKTGNRYTVSAL